MKLIGQAKMVREFRVELVVRRKQERFNREPVEVKTKDIRIVNGFIDSELILMD